MCVRNLCRSLFLSFIYFVVKLLNSRNFSQLSIVFVFVFFVWFLSNTVDADAFIPILYYICVHVTVICLLKIIIHFSYNSSSFHSMSVCLCCKFNPSFPTNSNANAKIIKINLKKHLSCVFLLLIDVNRIDFC